MKKNSLQNQWDNAAEGWADFVRTGKDYFRDELNNPAMFELLGDICRSKNPSLPTFGMPVPAYSGIRLVYQSSSSPSPAHEVSKIPPAACL